MALSVEKLMQRLARQVYANDGRTGDHYPRETFPFEAEPYVIIYEGRAEKNYRASFEIGEDDVILQPAAEWVEVTQEWQPVTAAERSIMEASKRAVVDTTEARKSAPHASIKRHFEAHYRAGEGSESEFLLMSEAVARDGISLDPDGLDTTAFMRNPVLLWQHGTDERRGSQPIGRIASLTRQRSRDANANGWLARVEWYDDDFSTSIRDQYKRGFLHAVSVSWIPLERKFVEMETPEGRRRVPRDVRSEMLELSAVGVPGDANALVTQRSEQASTQTDAPPPQEPTTKAPSLRHVAPPQLREIVRARRDALHQKALQQLGRA